MEISKNKIRISKSSVDINLKNTCQFSNQNRKYNQQQKYVSQQTMSFHKLKIGSRKKESSRSNVNSNEKLKQKNEELNLNIDTKLHSRKANIISMSDDFNHDIFKLKKHEFSTAPKTDRVHKIQRLDSFTTGGQSVKDNAQTAYHFSYGNGEENQEYSASQVIEFLNVKQSEGKGKEGSGLKMAKHNSMGSNGSYQSEKVAVIESVKPRVHQIKQITPTEVQSKVKQAFEIRKKVIELQEQPLNCELAVVKKQSTQGILDVSNVSANSQVAQNNQTAVKQNTVIPEQKQTLIKQKQVANDTKVVHMIKKESWSSSESVQTRDNKLSSSVLIMKTPEKQKNQPSQNVIPLNPSPHSEESAKSHSIGQKSDVESLTIQHKPVQSNNTSLPNNTSLVSEEKSRAQLQSPVQPVSEISPTKSKLSYRPINEVEVTILQQNKLLTQQIQKLRKQRDELQFSNKRYEVQLMQSNCQEYYDKEIKRLRNQVQTLQSTQEELKHNNFILQNKCKQLQSSQDIKKKQIKKILKQLEASKIDSAKEKHQLKEKSASLQFLIKQLQQRNLDLSNKFQEYYKKFNQIEKQYKIKSQQQQNLKKYVLNLQNKLTNNEKTTMEKLKHYENGLNTHSSARNQVQNEYREFKRQSETQIESLKQNIKQLNLKRQSQTLLISSRIKTLEKHNNTIEAQLQVVRLEETVKQLQTEITKRSQLIRELNNKIDSMISMKDYEQLRKQLELVNLHNAQLVQEYEKEIMNLNINIQQLKNSLEQAQKDLQLMQHDHILCETTKSNNQSKPSDHSLVQKQNFKEILKQQILQSDNLKQQLFSKSQIHFKLKEEYEQLKVKHQSLKNQLEIMKKQFSSYQNNSKIKNDIVQQELINEIDSMKRKISLLEKRFESKVKENKEKEQFIKDYVIGNNGKQNDAQYLVKELQRIFLQKQKIDSLAH